LAPFGRTWFAALILSVEMPPATNAMIFCFLLVCVYRTRAFKWRERERDEDPYREKEVSLEEGFLFFSPKNWSAAQKAEKRGRLISRRKIFVVLSSTKIKKIQSNSLFFNITLLHARRFPAHFKRRIY